MNLWDSIITVAIIVGAAFYLYRKFRRTRTSGGGCGCSGEGGCGNAPGEHPHSRCGNSRHP